MAERVHLPSIIAASESMDDPEQTSPLQRASNMDGVFGAFSQSVERMAGVRMPEVDPAAPMKVRISTLEAALHGQENHNHLARTSLLNLSDSFSTVDQQIKSMMLAMQQDFDRKLVEMKKEYDHRYTK